MVQPKKRIHLYAKDVLLENALQFLLASYGYECQVHTDLDILIKTLEGELSSIAVIYTPIESEKYAKLLTVKNTIFLVKNSDMEENNIIYGSHIHVIDRHKINDKLIALLVHFT